jgi:hypothetical protein
MLICLDVCKSCEYDRIRAKQQRRKGGEKSSNIVISDTL